MYLKDFYKSQYMISIAGYAILNQISSKVYDLYQKFFIYFYFLSSRLH